MVNKVTKIRSSLRLTPKTKALLEVLARETGRSQTMVIEQAIIQMAKRESIELPRDQMETEHTGA
jgi:predicted transcriptional regulator